MLKKTITFTDYDGNERTEDHYFNLNRAELTKWLTTTGDYTLDKVLLRLQTEKNGKKIIEAFESLLRLAYGKKSLDGRRFVKNEEIWNDFYQTEAYSSLFMELVTNGDKAADFVNAIIPKNLANEVEKMIQENPEGIPEELKEYVQPMLLNNK